MVSPSPGRSLLAYRDGTSKLFHPSLQETGTGMRYEKSLTYPLDEVSAETGNWITPKVKSLLNSLTIPSKVCLVV